MAQARNEVRIGGSLIERGALRHTPAGVPALEFRLRHESRQVEAEIARGVQCDVQAVALGQPARTLAAAPLGSMLNVTGFLAARSVRNQAPVLHVTTIEFLEGNEDGIQTQIEDRSQA